MLDFSRGTREVRVGDNQRMTLFPDSANPLVYHYLPNMPHIATMIGGSPGIKLFVYRENLDDIADDDPEAVAFLSLDVDLSWESELIEQAAAKIRLEDNLLEAPTLTPIFFRSGATKLMLLDAQTPDPDDAAGGDEPAPTRFVTSILGGGPPSLYGDNRAIFQAALSKRGAAALSGSLDGMTPIGVVYTLTFAGLQPAFNIKAKVDWQKVYDHFSSQENMNFLFYERDIQKSIDTLVENRSIELEVTISGIGADAMDAERKQAMDSIRQLIFDNFFEATIERETAAGTDTGTEVVDVLTSIHRNALTFGVGYTYRQKEVKIEQLRSLNIDWSVRRASERTIYPQAHMHTMLEEWQMTPADLVTIIDGGDALWSSQPFEIIAAAAWEADSIVAISVQVEYDDADSGVTRSWGTTLTKDKDRDEHRDWMDRTSGNAFRYKYEVVFNPDGIKGPKPKVNSGEEWLEYEGTALILHPRELYEKVQIEVAALANFPFDRWPAVHAFIRYRDESGYEHYDDALVTQTSPSYLSNFRIDAGVEGTRELRLSYVGASGERVETEWMPVETDQWPIEDPQADRLDVMVIVAGNRKNIQTMAVDLEYRDDEAGIHETGRLTYTEDTLSPPQIWTVHLDDPTKRRYRYRMTLVTKEEGDFIQTGWISTDAPTLPVGEKYARRMTVEVVTGDLKTGYRAVEVELKYATASSDREESKTFTMAPNARAEWQIDLEDPGDRDYEVTMTWLSDDGFNRSIGPVTQSNTLIAVPSEPPE